MFYTPSKKKNYLILTRVGVLISLAQSADFPKTPTITTKTGNVYEITNIYIYILKHAVRREETDIVKASIEWRSRDGPRKMTCGRRPDVND